MTTSFSVVKRNYGHWDICGESGRLFRIRGTPGDYVALDERAKPYPSTRGFATVGSCLLFISEQLMFEQIVSDENSPGNNRPIKT